MAQKETVFLKYVPHGVDETKFYRHESEEDVKRAAELRKKMFGEDDVQFVVLYNNRNIRRKMTGDVVLAFRHFILQLPETERDRCRLVLHTQPVDDNGTDLIRLVRDVAPEIRAVFSPNHVSTQALNDIYNISDVVINLASNEGFGLGTLEAMMAERLIVVNVTGGLQDQCGFRDENGDYLHEDVHYSDRWGSNHDGRYKRHGRWVFPCFPAQRALIGSPPTPYIFDDRCSWEEAGNQLLRIYEMPAEERAARGADGREFALANGMSNRAMSARFIDGIDAVLAQWKPRKRFVLVKAP